MAKSIMPKHTDGLIKYLSHPNEKANEDLAIGYFRHLSDKFTRQFEAGGSDGYVPGHFVLELKGKSNDWYSGLLQGFAYKRKLDFSVIVVATNGMLGIWRVEDIPEVIQHDILTKKSAPNKIGKELSKTYKNFKEKIRQSAIWYNDSLLQLLKPDKEEY